MVYNKQDILEKLGVSSFEELRHNILDEYKIDKEGILNDLTEIEDKHGIHLNVRNDAYDCDLDMVTMLTMAQALKMNDATGTTVSIPRYDTYAMAMAVFKCKTDSYFRRSLINKYDALLDVVVHTDILKELWV